MVQCWCCQSRNSFFTTVLNLTLNKESLYESSESSPPVGDQKLHVRNPCRTLSPTSHSVIRQNQQKSENCLQTDYTLQRYSCPKRWGIIYTHKIPVEEDLENATRTSKRRQGTPLRRKHHQFAGGGVTLKRDTSSDCFFFLAASHAHTPGLTKHGALNLPRDIVSIACTRSHPLENDEYNFLRIVTMEILK